MTTWKIRVTLRMKPLIKEGRSIRQEIWTIDDVMALPRQLWTACLPTLHFFFFSAMLPACGILIPLGTEFSPSAVKAQSPNHWTTRNSTILSFTREKQERKENPKQFQSLSLFFFFFLVSITIKITGKNTNNLRCADDATLKMESEDEFKSFLMRVKEKSEKAGLKLNIQKSRIMDSGPIISWQIEWRKVETCRFYFGGLQYHCGQ